MFELNLPLHLPRHYRSSNKNDPRRTHDTLDICTDIKYHLKYTLYYNTLMPLRQRLSDTLSNIPPPTSPLEMSLIFRVRNRADLDAVAHTLPPGLLAAVDQHLYIVGRLRAAGKKECGEVSDEAFHASAALLGNLGRLQDEVGKIDCGREVLEGWMGRDPGECPSFGMWKVDTERAVRAYTRTLKFGGFRRNVMTSSGMDSPKLRFGELLKVLDRDEPGVLWCEMPWLRELCMLKFSWTKRLSRKVVIKVAGAFDGGRSPGYQRLREAS